MRRGKRVSTLNAWYSSYQACDMAGVSYRQLDYWARTGAIRPAVGATGSGTQRRWSAADITVLRCLGRLAALGCESNCFVSAGRQLAELSAVQPLRGWVLVTPDCRVFVGDVPPRETGWCIPVESDSALALARRVG